VSYDIQPRETARVSTETDFERHQLETTLQRMVPLLNDAMGGARPSAPVYAELDHFLAEHYKNTREILARIDSALEHGQLAVDAYVRGDTLMAEQYGRVATAFEGVIPPFSPRDAGAVQALPDKVGDS
jgi:hydrogenase maturation factor HypE